jgi:hypothetical protein
MKKKISYLYADSDDKNYFNAIEFLGHPRAALASKDLNYFNSIRIDGWFYNKYKEWLKLECLGNNGNKYILPIQRLESNDISIHFRDQDAKKNRFDINLTDEQGRKCELVFQDSRKSIATLMNNTFPKQFEIGSGLLYVQSANQYNAQAAYLPVIKVRLLIISFYESLVPIITLLGIITAFLSFFNRNNMKLKLLIFFIYGMYITRISVLTIVEATSFPVRSEAYMSVGFILPIVASLLSIYLFFKTWFSNEDK